MAQLTIEIPDALLPELEQVRSQLPMLLTQWITASRVIQPEIQQTASQEVLSFLMQQPMPQDILNFKVSDVAQGRLKLLLDRNREGRLSEDESLELDGYEQLDQLIQMLKIRAYSVVHQKVED
jgi:predicted XRE-type DNA-binding protein